MSFIDSKLKEKLTSFKESHNNKLLILTGAGLSSASGIPTFRDNDGFWTIGSKNYVPEEMATYRTFDANPWDVWQWYLYRATMCQQAKPNDGHFAIKKLEDIFQERFLLISQNVDGLHKKAGSSAERTYLIHGSIEHARCSADCPHSVIEVSSLGFGEQPPLEELKAKLICPKCDAKMRPHILWFDEMYDEEYYRYESSVSAALQCGLLIIVGTSGATSLPNTIVDIVARRNATIIDVNTQDNIFAQRAKSLPNGFSLCGKSSDILPELSEFLAS